MNCRWIIGELTQSWHATDDADLWVALVPERVGDSQGKGGGVCAKFRMRFQVFDELVCPLQGGYDSYWTVFEWLGIEVNIVVEDGLSEFLEKA